MSILWSARSAVGKSIGTWSSVLVSTIILLAITVKALGCFWEAQAPYHVHVLFWDLAVVETVAHSEEDLAGELGVGATLVSWADTLDLEDLGEVLKTGFRLELLEDIDGVVVDRSDLSAGVALDGSLHEVLDIVDRWEELLHEHLERGLVLWKRRADHELGEVSKVVAPVEGDPSDVLVADHSRTDQQRTEVEWIDTITLQGLEIDSGVL